MRITLRIVAALLCATTLVVGVSTFLQSRAERARLLEDLDRRASILAESIDSGFDPAFAQRDRKKMEQLVGRFSNRGRVRAIAITSAAGELLALSPELTDDKEFVAPLAQEALRSDRPQARPLRLTGRDAHAHAHPLHSEDGAVTGALLIVQDTGYISERMRGVWQHNFLRLVTHVFLLSLVTLWIIRWDILAPVAQMAEWMKQLRAGETVEPPSMPRAELFAPMAREVKTFARHLSVAKIAAEEEARLRQASESMWTSERLKDQVRSKLGGQPLVVVSNREPYMHRYKGREVEVIVPAGGVVTALEPMMRACGGTWIAHGAGDADRDTADAAGRIRVPPEDPVYTLRRIPLTAEEENGYYYGF
ncbi:MAG: hypothetical protein HY553_08620, partial [Elusimicrobia bacterium]|nr:hypothetical protein [Elusimicrobiota bacterium]